MKATKFQYEVLVPAVLYRKVVVVAENRQQAEVEALRTIEKGGGELVKNPTRSTRTRSRMILEAKPVEVVAAKAEKKKESITVLKVKE